MRIQNKLNIYGGEFARPTKYTAMVLRPAMLESGEEISLDILCKSVTIPETTNTPIDMTFKGHPVKIPGRTNQAQTVEMTFYLDERYNTRRMFQEWIDILDPRYYATNNPAPESNMEKYGTLIVYARDFNETGAIVEEFNFENAFPISISDLAYSASDKDTVMEFTVTFAYYRMINNPWVQGTADVHDDYLDGFSNNTIQGNSTNRHNYKAINKPAFSEYKPKG